MIALSDTVTSSLASIGSNNDTSFAKGDWITAIYNNKWFPGCIEDVVNGQLTVSFMNRKGNRFYWPTTVDRQTLIASDILCRMKSQPYSVSSRLSEIADSDCREIDLLFTLA